MGIGLEVSNLSKNFGKKKILDKLSLSCNAGESIVILGESGMGKSVFMRIIGTLLEANSGNIKIGGTEIIGIHELKRSKVMRKIGFLFQNSGQMAFTTRYGRLLLCFCQSRPWGSWGMVEHTIAWPL